MAGATPRLIILDLDMPEMNGFQVLAQLKQFRPQQLIPIIIYSAMDSLNNPQFKLNGVVSFVTKGQTIPSILEIFDRIENHGDEWKKAFATIVLPIASEAL